MGRLSRFGGLLTVVAAMNFGASVVTDELIGRHSPPFFSP
jgi:hypothetical protein